MINFIFRAASLLEGIVEGGWVRIAITGANGFVGKALATTLIGDGYLVRPVVRSEATDEAVAVGDIGPETRLVGGPCRG
ncbi:MAG: hypothetical protein U5J62_06310 [Desulfurivibrio sp.]|nr:hypothetical protein [Desulfurivibrio sp.]